MNFGQNINRFVRRESPINCMLFAEFDQSLGPTIVCQTPKDFLSDETFKTLYSWLIPKPDLSGKLITINILDMKIVGFPVLMKNEESYDRNQLIFNMCFVCSNAPTLRTIQYEPIVRKLANYLLHLELECGFISNRTNRPQLLEMMIAIREQLNTNRCCSVEVTPSSRILLRVVPVKSEPMHVLDYDVPIFVRKQQYLNSTQLDLTTKLILPFIDGYRSVSRISSEADVDMSLVKTCVQHLIYYGVIALNPIFQYSNTYMTTPRIAQLAHSSSLQDECLSYVKTDESEHLPTFRSVFQLYCSMTPGITVKDLCLRFKPCNAGIDEQKLIRFGVLKGFIRRLQKYPIFRGTIPVSFDESINEMYRLFDGNHSYDEICGTLKKSYRFVEQGIEQNPDITICWK